MFRTHVDTPFYLYVIIFEDVNIQRSMIARHSFFAFLWQHSVSFAPIEITCTPALEKNVLELFQTPGIQLLSNHQRFSL